MNLVWSALMVLSAVGVLVLEKKKALWAFCGVILGALGLMFSLNAAFLATLQALFYTGLLTVLFALAAEFPPSKWPKRALIVRIAVAFTLVVSVFWIFRAWPILTWPEEAPLGGLGQAISAFSTKATYISAFLFTRYVLIFEVSAVILLAAMITVVLYLKNDDA
ncbi:MAG: hypothetical protein A2Y14_03995 [Verrucomicrobia bacterium GWF2_51_19]|nr:MAG: hypothetical protein A2Y14_03995 [Verrucomicrobia bacterium GWF2_51_19]